jgi:hypothetical protein
LAIVERLVKRAVVIGVAEAADGGVHVPLVPDVLGFDGGGGGGLGFRRD